MTSLRDHLVKSMKERELQAAIEAEAVLRRWFVYHTFNSIGSHPGFPDLVLARTLGGPDTSRLVFAELKTARGRISPDQRLWLEALRRVSENVAIAVEAAAELAEVSLGNVTLAWTPSVEVYTWRPSDWFDGRIAEVLR